MPRRKFIDKKNATTFQLVYRAQNDPRIHDPEASDMVFTEVQAPNSNKALGVDNPADKIRSRVDLDKEFSGKIRENEGEAANYGIYYDDTKYDYMQHLRDLGTSSESYFVEAPTAQSKKGGKGKAKMSLEDALREATIDDSASEGGVSLASNASQQAREIFGEDMLPSDFVRKTSYQDQQNIPDALAGFQPDMDPRLREVLEALEDEAYVDDEEDLFAELTDDGLEVDQRAWESLGLGEMAEDDGWETDDTLKPDEFKTKSKTAPSGPDDSSNSNAHAEEGGADWMTEFNKFKRDVKASKVTRAPPSDMQSSVLTGMSSLAGGRKKKRKGALTSTSSYSMTSSALFRTEGQSLLDERFDKIAEEYADDDYIDDGASVVSGMTGVSQISGISQMSGLSTASDTVPQLRSDFDSIMDDFLGGYSMSGKRRVKKGGRQSGMEQLEEIRSGLGPARIKPQKV